MTDMKDMHPGVAKCPVWFGRRRPHHAGKENQMRDTIRVIEMSLASMAGFLLVSGAAWAQATETPVSGEVRNTVLTDPGKVWVDEEGVLHIRNESRRERYSGDIRGQQFKVESYNIDLDPVTGDETGDLDYHGSFTFVGFVGPDRVTARGRITGLCRAEEPNNCEEIEIWHLDDGRKINLTEVYSWYGGPSVYEGILLGPPGRR
jgi:hypothetical protein